MHSIGQLLVRHRRLLVIAGEAGAFCASGLLAFLLRFDFQVPAHYLPHLAAGLAVWTAVKLATFTALGVHRRSFRYVSLPDLVQLGVANFTGSVLSAGVLMAAGPPGFPRSILLLDLILCFLLTAGTRVSARLLADARRHNGFHPARKRTLIYGAGDAGLVLLRECQLNPSLPYAVAGFIDDDTRKKGLKIHGVEVLGGGAALEGIAKRQRAEMVLIAIPSATGAEMTRILRLCHQAGLAYKTVPGLAEVVEGNGLASQICDVAVEDLLGRTPVRLEEHRIRARVEGKVVLVTGAAGSIGSELCRQLARFSPAAIVGFEIAESPLFEIDREMRQAFPQIPFHPEIGSIQNRARLDEVFRHYAPSVVYHAAAYKHVPMMEAHVFEAIENNVFGTYNVAVAAAGCGAEQFVLISSDKAVRPSNVMGATKRLAELLVLSLANGGTSYVAVRFGNVLGSNGSVIPIFKRQIAQGGPVTVTHPEMRRYFMTIPEACQLVLQAASLEESGKIFVLDMGEPVKIVDLARNLILLSGLKPEEEIRIEFTGVRPGEKLYEELSTVLEGTVETPHEKVRVYTGNGLPEEDMAGYLASLRRICQSRDLGELVITLKDAIPDYNPSSELLHRLIGARRVMVAGRG
jgi:FlaA1/EpsC-like NDP-sugar epimerase